MTTYYNNVPQPSQAIDSAQSTLQVFDAYTTVPLTVESATYDAMTGYFTSRGFGEDAAVSLIHI